MLKPAAQSLLAYESLSVASGCLFRALYWLTGCRPRYQSCTVRIFTDARLYGAIHGTKHHSLWHHLPTYECLNFRERKYENNGTKLDKPQQRRCDLSTHIN